MRLTPSLARPIGCLAALSAVAGCGKQPSAEAGSAAVPDVAAAEPDAPPDGVEDLLDARAVAYLDRYPGLSDDHRRRLAQDGFFLAPAGAPALFHVYQRNERLGLPSFVTADLALEILLAVVASVRNDVEAQSAAPDLYECLHAMLRRGLEIRGRSAGDPRSAREALDRAIAVVAVAAHLLGAEG
ncbi:MAG: DUF3160 domain-containing protein, partial [Myxococcota bacterium]|nr:DUF3160 domain-containing protein [Myxococcota bacterium]